MNVEFEIHQPIEIPRNLTWLQEIVKATDRRKVKCLEFQKQSKLSVVDVVEKGYFCVVNQCKNRIKDIADNNRKQYLKHVICFLPFFNSSIKKTSKIRIHEVKLINESNV